MKLRAENYYAVLRDRVVVVVDDVLEWAKYFEDGTKRRVAFTDLGAGVQISTVFLGLNHSFGTMPPMWFETLVFGGYADGEMRRYTTIEQAEAGHEEMVRRVSNREAFK